MPEIKPSQCDRCKKSAYDGLAGEIDTLCYKSGGIIYSDYNSEDVPINNYSEINLCTLCRSYLNNSIFDWLNNKENKFK